MATTLPNVEIPAGVWTELYTATGITTSEAINVQNLGAAKLLIYSGVTEPVTLDGYRSLKPGEFAENGADDVGAWVFSPYITGLVNITVAS